MSSQSGHWNCKEKVFKSYQNSLTMELKELLQLSFLLASRVTGGRKGGVRSSEETFLAGLGSTLVHKLLGGSRRETLQHRDAGLAPASRGRGGGGCHPVSGSTLKEQRPPCGWRAVQLALLPRVLEGTLTGDTHPLEGSVFPPVPSRAVQPAVCHTVKTVTTLIARVLFRRLVHFLAASEYHAVMLDFHAMGQFPGVTGCMDCTHVHIRSPSRDDAEVYRNRKGVFLNVQINVIYLHAITGPQLQFFDVVASWPGSVHDSCSIFDGSRLRALYKESRVPGLLLGDIGYACLPLLMTPLTNPGVTNSPGGRWNASTAKNVVPAPMEVIYGLKLGKAGFPQFDSHRALQEHLKCSGFKNIEGTILASIMDARLKNPPCQVARALRMRVRVSKWMPNITLWSRRIWSKTHIREKKGKKKKPAKKIPTTEEDTPQEEPGEIRDGARRVEKRSKTMTAANPTDAQPSTSGRESSNTSVEIRTQLGQAQLACVNAIVPVGGILKRDQLEATTSTVQMITNICTDLIARNAYLEGRLESETKHYKPNDTRTYADIAKIIGNQDNETVKAVQAEAAQDSRREGEREALLIYPNNPSEGKEFAQHGPEICPCPRRPGIHQ
ncbi:hypothetical protein HPB47_013509 [Ixodes persulcatus]|uniref:Uncharacterized protein n=1 Tax=Ixodes persulcatus TaxID=34615 RepID=A0AC60R1W4_IXOPE|nr:hypothetical protein HPB47_013509 [Ixodes persulcatus]